MHRGGPGRPCLDLQLNPDLKVVQETGPDQKQPGLAASVPLVGQGTDGCVLECDLAITARLVLRSAARSESGPPTRLMPLFSISKKSDGEDNQCTLSVREGGKERVIATWKNVECAKYRLILKRQKDGVIRFLARQGTTEVFHASCEAPPSWKLDEFFLWVANNKNDNGYIGYDCEEENIQMRSQPGGGEYVLTAVLDFLSVKAIRQGAEK